MSADSKNPEKSISFSRICCDGNELTYIREVLDSGWLTTASKAGEFEARFAQAVGARYACAVNSCTAALHLAAEAIGISKGDKVFVPTMTFTATAEVIRYLGADPVFLDVDYSTCLVSPDGLRNAIHAHPEVKSLIIVHYGGQPAQMHHSDGKDGILEVCRAHGIRIIEDAAHAFPTRAGDKMVGSLGDVTCFSFYANKTMTTGEGGMLTTDDEDIWKRAKVMRLHGIDRDIWGRFTSDLPSWEYDVVAPGFKYNMPDVNAAIGLAQLEQVYAMRDERQRCALRYLKNLAGIESIDLPDVTVDPASHAWHLFPIIVKPCAPISRDELIEELGRRGIGTSVHYKPIHRMSYYRDRYELNPSQFPNAERIWSGCLSLPIYPSLQNEDVDYVCSSVEDILST
jgi:dTDP-4-amino-4,6-dideoxygalactose transaminase